MQLAQHALPAGTAATWGPQLVWILRQSRWGPKTVWAAQLAATAVNLGLQLAQHARPAGTATTWDPQLVWRAWLDTTATSNWGPQRVQNVPLASSARSILEGVWTAQPAAAATRWGPQHVQHALMASPYRRDLESAWTAQLANTAASRGLQLACRPLMVGLAVKEPANVARRAKPGTTPTR